MISRCYVPRSSIDYGGIRCCPRPGQSFRPDGRRQVLCLRAPTPLARRRALPWVRQRPGDPRRVRRPPTAPATLPLQGVRAALRRPHQHGAGRASPAAAGVGAVPLLHGAESRQSADRPGAGPQRVGCAGHDRAVARWIGGQSPGRAAGGRGGDRRGLRRGRAQGPTRGGGQKGRRGRRRRLAGAPGRGTLAKGSAHCAGRHRSSA